MPRLPRTPTALLALVPAVLLVLLALIWPPGSLVASAAPSLLPTARSTATAVAVRPTARPATSPRPTVAPALAPTVEDDPLALIPKCSAITRVDQDPARPTELRWIVTCAEGGTLTLVHKESVNTTIKSPFVGTATLGASVHRSPPPQSKQYDLVQVPPKQGVIQFIVIGWTFPPTTSTPARH